MSERKIVGIHQPNFLPWLGYFHKMVRSDVFVLLDDVQYSKNSVGNRSFLRRKDGQASYLTAPVKLSKKAFQNYNEIELDYGPRWPHKGLNMVKDAYQKAPYFQQLYPAISEIILQHHPHLASLNIALINFVIQYLNIQTKIVMSHTINVDDAQKSDLVLEINKQLKASIYLSGTGAKKYNDEQSFRENNIEVAYTQFTIADEYKARDEKNELVNLSILHFLFNYDVEKIRELVFCNTVAAY